MEQEQWIYCVEDDDNIRELICYALKSGGFSARGFGSTEGFYQAVEAQPPALALLDIMLPGQDGMEILRRLRKNTKTPVPVIMLTAKTTEFDKVAGLDAGADDYITKPFSVLELLSRVRAVLRRTAGGKEELLCCGDICLDPRRRTVEVEGKTVELTYKEFELLHYLLRNRDLVLSRTQIMEKVWGFDFEGESRTVDMHIKTLRQKLGEAGGVIKTVRGVGYKAGGEEREERP